MKKSSPLLVIICIFSLLAACASNTSTPLIADDTDLIATTGADTISAIPSATNASIPTLTSTENVTPTTDSMTGWKSYRSENYGFTFEYPSDKFNVSGDNPIKVENTILPPDDGSQASANNVW